jgi:hypothetical protein
VDLSILWPKSTDKVANKTQVATVKMNETLVWNRWEFVIMSMIRVVVVLLEDRRESEVEDSENRSDVSLVFTAPAKKVSRCRLSRASRDTLLALRGFTTQ